MRIPDPVPGLVIRYGYLRRSELEAGRDEGVKDRPAAIIAAVAADVANDTDGTKRVLVLPITHMPPADLTAAVEIPAAVKRRLGLDDDASWIVLLEANAFTWPGPDLRPVPGDVTGSVAYGFLPPGLFARVRSMFIAAVESRRAATVRRTQ